MQCTQLQLLTTPKNSVSHEPALCNVQAQVQRGGSLSTQGKQASPQATDDGRSQGKCSIEVQGL